MCVCVADYVYNVYAVMFVLVTTALAAVICMVIVATGLLAATKYDKPKTTLTLKKTSPFCFPDIFVIVQPISLIFGRKIPPEI